MWLGGQKPCADDRLAVDEIRAAPPRAETHPNTFAWWAFASKFSDAVRNTWTGNAIIPLPKQKAPVEEEKKGPAVSIPDGQPVADPVYSMMFD